MMLTDILIPSSMTPRGIGIYQDREKIVPFAGCCGSKFTGLKYKGNDAQWYECDCRETKTLIEIPYRLREKLLHNAYDVKLYIEYWTGLKDVEVMVQW